MPIIRLKMTRMNSNKLNRTLAIALTVAGVACSHVPPATDIMTGRATINLDDDYFDIAPASREAWIA